MVTVWAVGLYVLGVAVLRRRGDRWPVGRTLAFVGLGMGSFFFATSSGLGRYDTTLLSVHMVQHMMLSMVVPLALALGAPVTLALRTLPPAPRRWLLAVLHSRFAKVLAFPPLAFALYVASPWALYFCVLVRRQPGLGVRPRDDARAPGARRHALLLAADGDRPGARPGQPPVPGAADAS